MGLSWAAPVDSALISCSRAGEDLLGSSRCVHRTAARSYRTLRMHGCAQQPYTHIKGRSAHKQLLCCPIILVASSWDQQSVTGSSAASTRQQHPPACTQTQRMRAWSAARPCMRGEVAPCRVVQPWRCPCAGAVMQQAVHSCLPVALGTASSAPMCGQRSSRGPPGSPRRYCWLQWPPLPVGTAGCWLTAASYSTETS